MFDFNPADMKASKDTIINEHININISTSGSAKPFSILRDIPRVNFILCDFINITILWYLRFTPEDDLNRPGFASRPNTTYTGSYLKSKYSI